MYSFDFFPPNSRNVIAILSYGLYRNRWHSGFGPWVVVRRPLVWFVAPEALVLAGEELLWGRIETLGRPWPWDSAEAGLGDL